jgi:hypothetical protein
VFPAGAYGGYKDVNEAWVAGVLTVDGGPTAALSVALRKVWAERVAMMAVDGGVPLAEAERLAWVGLEAAATDTASRRDGETD